MEMAQTNNEEQLPLERVENKFRYFPFFNQKQPIFVLVLIGIIFYCTSLYNEYALDDGIIIHQNSYVLKGINGIGDILSKDAYHSFYQRMNAKDQLQGGRYRPLAVMSYAIEQEIIGTYRTGNYMFVDDLNRNGILDENKVPFISATSSKILMEYEYNEFIDINNDGVAQMNECNNCWDTNKNFTNDYFEDLNQDGLFNEVDCQVNGAFLRHFNNMWLYILACVLLHLFFRNYIFKEQQDVAFLAALIFLIHPVHTEIVANVKGREDILSVIFIALTFLFAFRFLETKKIVTFIITCIMFFLALLSKEYAVMLLVLIPIGVYVFNKIKIENVNFLLISLIFIAITSAVIYVNVKMPKFPIIILMPLSIIVFAGSSLLAFRNSVSFKGLSFLMIGLFSFALLYLGLRLNAVNILPGVPDTEILNNPYLLADGEEQLASKISVLLRYLVLSIFPDKLTCDYSYAQIAYSHFTDVTFIISLILNLGLLALGILLIVKRHVLGFAIIIYFAFLLLVANFIFSIGAVMHEGLLFHSTIGVAIVLAYLAINALEKLNSVSMVSKRAVIICSLIIITVASLVKTWERNWDWKNDITLFLKDVNTSPNSVLVLGNAGARWVDLADTKEITGINIPGQDPDLYNDYNGTLQISNEEVQAGNYIDKRQAALYKGIGYLKHAVELHPRYVNGFLNLGLANYKLGKDHDAILYWKQAEFLYPNNPYLANYYHVYKNVLKNKAAAAFAVGKLQEALTNYKYATLVDPKDAQAYTGLSGTFYHMKKYDKAKMYSEKALRVDPQNTEAGKILEALQE